MVLYRGKRIIVEDFTTSIPTMKTQGGAKNEANNSVQVKTEEKSAEKIDFSKVEIEPLFKDDVDFETFSKSDFRAVKVKECTAVPKSKKLLQFTLDDGTGEDRTILSGIHEYVKTGKFDKKYSKYISQAFQIRNNTDYADFFLVSLQDAKEQYDRAEEFVKVIEEFLKME